MADLLGGIDMVRVEVEVSRAVLILYGSEDLNSKQRRDVQERLTLGCNAVEEAVEVIRHCEGDGVGLSEGVGEMTQATPAYMRRKPDDDEERPMVEKAGNAVG